MAIFDFSKYELKLNLEKPNDKNIYLYGDKIKGKVELIIKKPFQSKQLTLMFIKETQIKTKSKLDNKETIDNKKEFLYNDILYINDVNKPNDDFSPKFKSWDFQINLPSSEKEADKTLMQRYFDAFYPAEFKSKYYIQLLYEFSFPTEPKIITKEITIKEKL